MRNVVQGLVLLGGMVLVFAVIAWLFFGTSGILTVVIVGLVLGLIRPRIPTATVLRMYGAQPLPFEAAPELHQAIDTLAERAGLRRSPHVYYVRSSLMNAFATGRGKDAALGVTDGILRNLTGRQMVGVLAHEISHIRSGDTRIMNLSDALARMTHMLSYAGMWILPLSMPLTLAGDFRPLLTGLALIVLPPLMTMLQLALSRSREFDADLEGATLTGDPEGLATALEVLERADGSGWERLMVPRRRSPDPTLLRSHPSTEERTRRLRQFQPPATAETPAPDGPPRPAGEYPAVSGRPRLRAPGIRW